MRKPSCPAMVSRAKKPVSRRRFRRQKARVKKGKEPSLGALWWFIGELVNLACFYDRNPQKVKAHPEVYPLLPLIAEIAPRLSQLEFEKNERVFIYTLVEKVTDVYRQVRKGDLSPEASNQPLAEWSTTCREMALLLASHNPRKKLTARWDFSEKNIAHLVCTPEMIVAHHGPVEMALHKVGLLLLRGRGTLKSDQLAFVRETEFFAFRKADEYKILKVLEVLLKVDNKRSGEVARMVVERRTPSLPLDLQLALRSVSVPMS